MDDRVENSNSDRLFLCARYLCNTTYPSNLILNPEHVAGVLAVAHLIIFYHLDNRRVDQTIAQSYVANISTAFVTLFRICLVASLVLCFTQILWRKL